MIYLPSTLLNEKSDFSWRVKPIRPNLVPRRSAALLKKWSTVPPIAHRKISRGQGSTGAPLAALHKRRKPIEHGPERAILPTNDRRFGGPMASFC